MYCFRHRFDLAPSSRLDHDVNELYLAGEPEDELAVYVSSGKVPLRDAAEAVLQGRGFETADQADAAGRYWRGVLERSFAAVRVSADFQDRAARGGMARGFREDQEAKHGRPVLNDFGLLIYPCDPRPVFERARGGGISRRVGESFDRALEGAAKDDSPSQSASLAYAVYASAFTVDHSPDARFMMFMMALETLIEQPPRTEPVRDHVDALIRVTRNAELPEAEINSLLGSLRWLHTESIAKSGRALAATLEPRTYGGMSPSRFFTRCYAVRSALAHGHVPRPSRDEVNRLAAQLEGFVGDLIAGPEALATLDSS